MTEVGAGTLAEMLDERQHLLEIAIWMFGSSVTADRIVQETYRRWYALDDAQRAAIEVPRAWLTRVAGGICLDLLAAAAPVHALMGPARGGKVTAPDGAPDREGRERRLAPGSGLLPRQAGPRSEMLTKHDRVARRFASVYGAGDPSLLKAVLAEDAIVVSDGGGKLRAPVRPIQGAEAVARFVMTLPSGHPGTEVAAEAVNGRTGLVLRQEGRAVAVVSVSVAEDAVTAVWIVLNPDKLHRWHRS
jgi:RNA polymerase sigma-70 factor, ECF subfamily